MNAKPIKTIFAVDDEDDILDMLQDFLQRFDYKVFTAGNGREAARIGEEYREDIDLLIADVAMPGMNGNQLAQILVNHRPDMKVIFISGHPKHTLVGQGILDPDAVFIEKPFALKIVLDSVRGILESG